MAKTKSYCVRSKDRRLYLNVGEKPIRVKKGVVGWTFLTHRIVELPKEWFPEIKYESGPVEMRVWPKSVLEVAEH